MTYNTDAPEFIMDIDKALRELYKEKAQLDAAIAKLEAQIKLVSRTAPKSKRGRKSMGAEERLKVSQRMSKYWEARHAQVRALEGQTSSTDSAAPDPGNGI